MPKARIVITGGTRGLGFHLARAFLAAGSDVFIIGRSQEGVDRALASLAGGGALGAGQVLAGAPGDIARPEDLAVLAVRAREALGGVDHWINNAGVNQAAGRLLDLGPEECLRVLGTDLLGPLYAARAARGLLAETGGWLWFMEGHGSDGRIIDGLSLYGTAKRALAYLWRALAVETRGTSLRIGALSPGIMATDFILGDRDSLPPEDWARKARLYNILADRPETVAAFLVPRILAARRRGLRIAWLTTPRILARFLTAPFHSRHIVD